MPTFDEREHLVREFRSNTGASDTHARDVLIRNKWNLANSYKEVEQMCITSHRASMGPTPTVPPPSYSQQMAARPTAAAAPSRGGMEGGVGPAVSLDTRGVRPTGRVIPVVAGGDAGPQVHPAEGLKVMLPPVKAPVERVIPIQVEGGRTLYQSAGTSPDPASAAVSRMSLDEKVLPSQPGMVPPKMSSSNSSSNNSSSNSSSNSSKPQSTVPPLQSSPPPQPLEGYPRLKRGFSSIAENEILVTAARSGVLQDIKEDNHSHMFQTFMLPDFSIYPEEFRAFLNKQLIESSTLNSLESAGRLNWWVHQGLCQRLFPMATTGDGNCLLHAASLSMWGIHDRLLTLRNALHHTLTSSSFKDNLYRRWRWQQTQVNLQSGLVFSEEEWKTEWENILRLASPSPRSAPDSGVNANSCCDSPLTCSSSSSTDPVVYESLEEFHVFVLAHVLQRPIIVVADTILRDANGEALAPIPFGGIYLPLERSRAQCCTTPLLLTYDAAHFSALVPMEHDKSAYDASMPLAIPVVDPELKLLPLHFCYDPGPKCDWKSTSNKDMPKEPCAEDRLNLLKAYLDIIHLSSDTVLIGNPQVTSRQSSSGSEDGGTLNLLKEKKKDGKPNTVAKQFGSLGKTVGKKLKNLGNNLAPSKTGAKGGGQDGDKGQPVSLSGGVTHSTKFITALATTGGGENEEVVPCAKLACEFDNNREVFIENYLKNAEKCFQQEQELKRQRGEEQRSRVALHSTTAAAPLAQRPYCRTVGCSNYALPNISLCDLCASQQQWQQSGTLDRSRSRGQGQPSGYNTFPGRHKAPTGLPASTATNDEIYKCGKSKFYAATHAADPAHGSSTLQVLRHEDRQQSMSTGNVARRLPAPRPRSPSPDYDNVPRSKENNPKCATVGCDFYGSKEMGNLCSGCYKKRSQQQQHLSGMERTTKL